MARPRLGTEPYEALSVRLDRETIAALELYLTDLRQELLGARVDRGMVIRRLVLLGLQQLGYLPVPPTDKRPQASGRGAPHE